MNELSTRYKPLQIKKNTKTKSRTIPKYLVYKTTTLLENNRLKFLIFRSDNKLTSISCTRDLPRRHIALEFSGSISRASVARRSASRHRFSLIRHSERLLRIFTFSGSKVSRSLPAEISKSILPVLFITAF